MKNRLLNLYIPLFLVLAGFIWKIFYIDVRDLCLDEPFTIFNAQKSIGEIIRMSTSYEPTPPLFMLLLHFWIKLFGISALSVRFLPLVFNSLTVLFIYFTGKRFVSLSAGLLASGLFLFSYLHFFHGLNTRTYSLVSLETAAALYYFLCYATNQKNRKALAGLIISNILLVYSHYFGWFVILSEFISGFFYVKSLKMFFRFLISPFATLLAFAPMFPAVIKIFLTKSKKGTWLNPPHGSDYLNQLYTFFNFRDVFLIVAASIGAGIIFTLAFILLKRWKGFNISVAVLLQWWIVPYTIMFLTSFKVPMFNNSYNLFNSIGVYLFIAALVNFLFQKNKYVEPAVGLIIIVFMALNMRILPHYFGYREVKKSVEYVKQAQDENRIVILYPYWSDLQFAYYYDRQIFKDPVNFEDLMKANGIYNVWGLPGAREVVKLNPEKNIVYLQDGPMNGTDGDIFRFLDSAYVKRDSVHFPETFKACKYDLKPSAN